MQLWRLSDALGANFTVCMYLVRGTFVRSALNSEYSIPSTPRVCVVFRGVLSVGVVCMCCVGRFLQLTPPSSQQLRGGLADQGAKYAVRGRIQPGSLNTDPRRVRPTDPTQSTTVPEWRGARLPACSRNPARGTERAGGSRHVNAEPWHQMAPPLSPPSHCARASSILPPLPPPADRDGTEPIPKRPT